jgi:hypothetical protein
MDKRVLYRYWKALRDLKLRYLAAAVVVGAIVSAVALHNNNFHMLKLRDAVFTADKEGKDVQKPLQELQHYVTGHMNTDLTTGTGVYPPIQLKYTYDRLVEAESKQLRDSNTQLYNDAQQYCERLNPNDFSGRNRVPCIQQYVKDQGQPLKVIPDSLYKFDFVSPIWSPDLAGWSVLFTTLATLLLLALAGARAWLKVKTR